MKNELATKEETQIVAQGQSNILAVITDAAVNPDVDVEKMQALLDMQERIMNKQAEIEYNEAMARLQPKLPEIKKTVQGHNCKYAKYEHVDREIRPLYTAEGFSLSFTSKYKDGSETYYGTLSHVGGHNNTAEMILPPDDSGKKNAIQSKGSTISYAKRYLVGMLLNIVTVDEDDDGAAYNLEPITEEQFAFLQGLIDETETDIVEFCKWAKIDALVDATTKDYVRLKTGLLAKQKAAKKNAQNEDT